MFRADCVAFSLLIDRLFIFWLHSNFFQVFRLRPNFLKNTAELTVSYPRLTANGNLKWRDVVGCHVIFTAAFIFVINDVVMDIVIGTGLTNRWFPLTAVHDGNQHHAWISSSSIKKKGKFLLADPKKRNKRNFGKRENVHFRFYSECGCWVCNIPSCPNRVT